jgi:UDP-N-acetyl-D-mannosaminouronate:lipid I N-acetyl-D-mannosaminouronosyltransferase
MEQYSIDGIPVNVYESLTEASNHIVDKYVGITSSAVAINPEKIMLSRKDRKLRAILLDSEIRYSDGIGVVKLLEKKSGKHVARIPGCELWEALMMAAGQKNIPVFLVGASATVMHNTIDKLEAEYSVNTIGYSDGYFTNETALITEIKLSGAKIVTVAMGSPLQEIFIAKCKAAGIEAFFMGVGGTYDVYTGNVKRSPKLFCDLGLEWFYRLASKPSRIIRQTNLAKFLWLAISKKI